MKKVFTFAWLFLFGVSVAHADDAVTQSLRSEIFQLKNMVQELKVTVDRQTEGLRSQASRIEQLEGARPLAVAGPSAAPVATSFAQAPVIAGRWNPEIGVVADMAGKFTDSREDAEGEDRWSVRELEVVFGSNVDPYARLDATVSFSDFEEASLEEAYLTRFELPRGMTGRVGKFKPKVGKALPVHRDSLETVDEPLVIQRWFGAEGYNKAGADLTRMLELPFDSTHEITVGILEGGNGDEGTLFGARRRPTFYAHLKNYWELGDASGIEWGISNLLGSKDERVSSSVSVIGTDLTWMHRFSESTALKLQGEAFHQNRRDSQYEIPDDVTGDISFNDLDGTLWGGYGLADLRFHPQWSAGFRGDYVELVDATVGNPNPGETACTGYLTFYQSEFARWRAQITRFEAADNENDDWQLMLQGTFAIGEHKHKLT